MNVLRALTGCDVAKLGNTAHSRYDNRVNTHTHTHTLVWLFCKYVSSFFIVWEFRLKFPDTQLLLLLTQAVGCILRSDASTLNHLMQWGLSNSLAKCIRRCVDQQRKVNATESSQHEKGRKRRTGLSAVSICITCR